MNDLEIDSVVKKKFDPRQPDDLRTRLKERRWAAGDIFAVARRTWLQMLPHSGLIYGYRINY